MGATAHLPQGQRWFPPPNRTGFEQVRLDGYELCPTWFPGLLQMVGSDLSILKVFFGFTPGDQENGRLLGIPFVGSGFGTVHRISSVLFKASCLCTARQGDLGRRFSFERYPVVGSMVSGQEGSVAVPTVLSLCLVWGERVRRVLPQLLRAAAAEALPFKLMLGMQKP